MLSIMKKYVILLYGELTNMYEILKRNGNHFLIHVLYIINYGAKT